MSRHHSQTELREALRQVRGARGSAVNGRVRHSRNDVVSVVIGRIVAALNEAESHAIEAINKAQRSESKRFSRRAA